MTKPVLSIHPGADEPLRGLVRQLNAAFAQEMIDTSQITDASVTTEKLADNSVTSAKIADGGVATADLADNAVTDAKLRDSAALSVIGNPTNATADPADITAATDGHVLRRSGTAIGFGQVATAGIADDAVTIDKIADNAVDTPQLADDAVTGAELDETSNYGMAGLLMSGAIDLDGQDLILDADGDTFIDSPANDVIRFSVASTEIARFDSRYFFIDKTAAGLDTEGLQYDTDGGTLGTASTSQPAFRASRNSSDGPVIEIRQDNVTEGSIDVSGTTVSYVGAHLSRWAQLGAKRFDPKKIWPGTVMSNLDEICIRPQKLDRMVHLNRVCVSDIENDRHVTGVFSRSEMDNDDTHWDFLIAQCGDYFVRIGKNTEVEMGDLLVSAGDGTAKPQEDDLIRASTIAKVRARHKMKIYPDGSYTVPCSLLM